MSDSSTSEPVVPATTTPSDSVVPELVAPAPAAPGRTADEPAAPEPAADEPVAPEPVRYEPVAEPATVAPVAVERKKRGVGAWSFVLGLLTALGDIGFLIFTIVVLAGAASAVVSGDFSGAGTALGAAGLALLALFIFFGGFFTGGLAALLGLIALISGRGRVLGFLGLLFGIAAIALRVLLLSAGFSPDLG
jgi:hypothetical protein